MTATIDRPSTARNLSVVGIVRSEWVKLVTLRSTWWCLGLIAVMTAGFPVLISSVLASGELSAPEATLDFGSYNWTMANTVAVGFTVLIAAVLGNLVITGEYGTGMIRSTLAAAPGRVSTVLVKALVIGLTVLVVGGAALAVGALLSAPILESGGYVIDTGDARVWSALLGAAAYPALVAVFSVGIGALVRNSAGAIAAVLGLLLVVPTAVQLAGALLQIDWLLDVAQFLPSILGNTMGQFVPDAGAEVIDGQFSLLPWQAALALGAWVVAALTAGVASVTRRDV